MADSKLYTTVDIIAEAGKVDVSKFLDSLSKGIYAAIAKGEALRPDIDIVPNIKLKDADKLLAKIGGELIHNAPKSSPEELQRALHKLEEMRRLLHLLKKEATAETFTQFSSAIKTSLNSLVETSKRDIRAISKEINSLKKEAAKIASSSTLSQEDKQTKLEEVSRRLNQANLEKEAARASLSSQQAGLGLVTAASVAATKQPDPKAEAKNGALSRKLKKSSLSVPLQS